MEANSCLDDENLVRGKKCYFPKIDILFSCPTNTKKANLRTKNVIKNQFLRKNTEKREKEMIPIRKIQR